ncbi:MAG: LysM peptidoglycan-binding domain-containing protein [Luteolibacter sp.]
MKMKTQLASLLVILAGSGPLLSATEVERLRALCSEQEMQIQQLELKISRLTDTPPPSNKKISLPEVPLNSEPTSEVATYTVVSGDSIERIARKTGFSVSELTKLNNLTPETVIHPGQTIKLPCTTNLVENTPEKPASVRSHKVQSGETYYRISRKYGVSVDELIAANPGVNHRALRVGQSISIPSDQIVEAPEPKPLPSLSSSPSIPISNNPTPIEKPRASDKPVRINTEITYGDFALKHGTNTKRLDELNGLELDPRTVLATGSELYIPAQP